MARADLPSVRAAREVEAAFRRTDAGLAWFVERAFKRIYAHQPTVLWVGFACPLDYDAQDEASFLLVNIVEMRSHPILGICELEARFDIAVFEDPAFSLAGWIAVKFDQAYEQEIENLEQRTNDVIYGTTKRT